MRKLRTLANKVLVRFDLVIVTAPQLLSESSSSSPESLLADLTEKVPIVPATDAPNNELFRLFSNEQNVHKWHHYFENYERHFDRYRDRPIRMLEIGVAGGGSLRMWQKFFHPDSTIVGIDIDPSCLAHENADLGIHVRIGSQADSGFLAAVNGELGPFDVILDDGSHHTSDQIASFGALFRTALNDGGCYIVEDTHTSYWSDWVDSLETFIEFSKRAVDLLHEPYVGRVGLEFWDGGAEALEEARLTYLSANLSCVSFYDSIVVFDKKARSLPRVELRQ